MIPDWVSFRNKFCSRMKIVLHSHDKIDRLSLRRSRTCMRHSPQTTGFVVSSRNGVRFQFAWYQNEMSYQNENSFGLKTGMNSFQNDLCRGKISSRYHVNRYREIYGDGMNLFWNESHSGIMWTAPNLPVLLYFIMLYKVVLAFWNVTIQRKAMKISWVY